MKERRILIILIVIFLLFAFATLLTATKGMAEDGYMQLVKGEGTMITDERKRPKPIEKDGVCLDCEYAKQKFRESCYCTRYGIIIGYSKMECTGYKKEELNEHIDCRSYA